MIICCVFEPPTARQLLAPVRHEFEVMLTGQGEKRESWQETLGMSADAELLVPNKDRRDWSKERWSEYKVALTKGADRDFLDVDIEGTYRLFDKCGAAQASLHKRISGPGSKGGGMSNKSAEMYMFLDPMRNTKGNLDFFVFADNHRRLQYGEHRVHTARIDPKFRPNNANGTEKFHCTTDGYWMSPTKAVELKAAVRVGSKLAVPKNTHALGAKSGGCGAAVVIMKARVPLPAVDAADWPTDKYVTLQNDRSHSTFSRLNWFTSRLELPKGLQEFVPLDDGKAGKCGDELHNANCPRCAPKPPALQWTRKVGEQKVTAREDPLQAAAYEQALKRRPAPFVVQWRKQNATKVASAKGKGKESEAAEAMGDLVIAVNPATLVHRALANVSSGVARERSAAPTVGSGIPAVEWQVVRHEEKELAPRLAPFELKSNRRDPKVGQPPGWNEKFPLRPEQLRSLGWMIKQEQTTQPYVEEEVAESVLPALGLRMDGRARVERLVRGGIIADQVGYGKTAISIGAILANQIEWPKPPKMVGAGKNAKPAPVRAIPTKATLVLAPSQLLRQWPREVEKFSKSGHLNVVVIRTVADITNLTVAEMQEADVVIAATSVLRSPLYFERLARLAGSNSLPHCKATGNGRHFAASYRDCVNKLEDQVEVLTGEGGAAAAAKGVRKGDSKVDDCVTVGPKRLKGAKLIDATIKAGGEGFKHVERQQGEKAADLVSSAVSKPKSGKSTPVMSPANFRRQKPKVTAAPKSPAKTPVKSPAPVKSPPKKATTPRGRGAASSGMESPPPVSRVASPRGHLARSASKATSYREAISDDENDSEFEVSNLEEDYDGDFSDEATEDEEEADRKAARARKARKAKAKKRTRVGGDDDEESESSDKDHWGFETREVQTDWTETTSPPLEMFHWRRVIVDEFTYLKPSDRCVVLGLKSESRWCLSGTPPVGVFSDIKDTAALLGINLGSDEQPRFTKAEITKAETFQFFKEKPTQHWHANRHSVAQGFLDRFVRQNIAEIDEIRSEEIPVDIQLRPAERAIYLELDHYLQSMDMRARKKKRGGQDGDRDKRLAKVLAGSSTAEEALIKRCSKFELDDDTGTALRTCQDIVNVRSNEMENCKRDLRESVLDGRFLLREAHQLAAIKGEELAEDGDDANYFDKWENTIRSKGVGDPDATAAIIDILDAATLDKNPNHVYTKARPPVGSKIKVNFGKVEGQDLWFTGTVMSYAGQHNQKAVMRWDGNRSAPAKEVDTKHTSIANGKIKVITTPKFGWEAGSEEEHPKSPSKKGKAGSRAGSAKSTPTATPRKGAKAVETGSSAAPTPVKPGATPGTGKKEKQCSINDKLWELREHTHDLRKLVKELVGRVRSLRFFQSVRDLQQMDLAAEVPCLACECKEGSAVTASLAKGKGKRALTVTPAHPKSDSGVLSTCGHVGCLKCLKANADLQECGITGCDCPARYSSVVAASSLGTEVISGSAGSKKSAMALKSPTKAARRGKASAVEGPTNEALELGVHGTKMAHLVQHIRDVPADERILVFVQFPDLMKQVSDVLEAASIKTLKLKGSVHQQTGALDEFQKEKLGKNDARVLLLLSRDESASGANLTSANHAIFVHPLLTTTQYEYVASETQAIGRIRRYGQTKTVKVWRFLVRDSIDTEIIKQRVGDTATASAGK